MKYMVMECRAAYAVVLSEDGRFLKVANKRYAPGQTVTEITPLVQQAVSPTPRRWLRALGSLAACLVLVVSAVFFSGWIPCASIYLSINPQVRIDVSRTDRVTHIHGMNGDGQLLLEGYDHRRKDLDTVMDELVDRAIDMGYLHEGGRITLSLDGSETWISGHSDHLNRHLTDHLTGRITVTIDITKNPPDAAQPTLPEAPIVIPVVPDSYEDSDYGNTPPPENAGLTPGYSGESSMDSGYDGNSDYSEPQAPAENSSGYADSGYGGTEQDDSEYGDSHYMDE